MDEQYQNEQDNLSGHDLEECEYLEDMLERALEKAEFDLKAMRDDEAEKQLNGDNNVGS